MADRWRNLLGRLAGGEDTLRARVDLLNRLELFARLSERQRRRLAEALILRRYEAGDALIQQGDTGLGMFILLSGRVEVTKRQAGSPVQLAVLGPGEFAGEMSLIDDQPRSASVRALEPVDCLVLTRAHFYHLTRQMPEFLWDMMPAMVGRIRRTSERIVSDESYQSYAGQTIARDIAPREKPTEPPASEPQNAGLFEACAQFSMASMMLGSAFMVLGAQESLRLILGGDQTHRSLAHQEQILSDLISAIEENLTEKSQHALDSFWNSCRAWMGLFGL